MMEPAAHQRVPITVVFGEVARPPLVSVTRTFDDERVDVALSAVDWVPPPGTAVTFTVRLSGRTVEGHGRVTGCHASAGHLDELLLDIEVTSFEPGAEIAMRHVGFRQRLVGWVERHPGEAGALPEALRRPQGAPDTRPTGTSSQVPRIVPSPDEPDAGAAAGRSQGAGGDDTPRAQRSPERSRPRARRHHWDLDSRYRPRG